MEQDNYIIKMDKITKRFGGTLALEEASLFVRKGEIHALVGENGAGKSTLMRILSGACITDKGTIQIQGKDVALRSSKEALINYGIGMVFQEGTLVPTISVAENIFIPQEAIGSGARLVNWASIIKKAKEVLNELGVNINVQLDAGEYSLEERCLIEVARNLVMNVRILILDELGATLTASEMSNVFEILLKLKDKGCTIIFISHRLEEVMDFADSVTVLRKGKNVSTLERNEVTHDKLVELMTGGVVDYSRKEKEVVAHETPLLRLENFQIKGGNKINLNLFPGKIIGLAGVAGSGRSEMLRAIFGIDPYKGKIFINGHEATIHNPMHAIAYRIGYLPKERKLEGIISDDSVVLNTTCMSLKLISKSGFLIRQKEIELTKEGVEKFSISCGSIENVIDSLSGGNQQKVLFTRLISAGTNILLCDEPTRGVDISSRQLLHEQILQHAIRGGGVIISSSELPELFKLSDLVVVMRKGTVVGQYSFEEVNEEKIISAMCSDYIIN